MYVDHETGIENLIKLNDKAAQGTFIFKLHEECYFDKKLFAQLVDAIKELARSSDKTEKEEAYRIVRISQFILKSIIYHHNMLDGFEIKNFADIPSSGVEDLCDAVQLYFATQKGIAEREQYESMQNILRIFIYDDHYNLAIKRLQESLPKYSDLKQKWEVFKSAVEERKLKVGEPLKLVHDSANRPLDENTDAEAYRWLDLFVKNVESGDGEVEEY